jgi:hypothetical protein
MEQPHTGGIDFNVLSKRLQRLATLDMSVFDEVRADASATVSMAAVAAASMLLFGFGGWLWWLLQENNYDSGEFLFKSTILGAILSLFLWFAAIAITYVMLHQVFAARVDLQELARVMCLAAAPLALGVLMFVWEIGFGISVAAIGLAFGAVVLAVQKVTDATPGRVLAAAGAGFLVWAIILTLFGSDDWLAPSIFVFAPTG